MNTESIPKFPPLPAQPVNCRWGEIRRCPEAVFPIHCIMALYRPGAAEWEVVRPRDGAWGGDPEVWYTTSGRVHETDVIDRLFLELAQFTTATTPKEYAKQEKIRELWRDVPSLKWLIHEAASRLETIRDTHPSIDTADLLARLRAAVPGIPEFEPMPEP